ncbi:N-6 DNA methylase [Undibacterium sp. Tian12W]|uniref:N-6 DNA methylase n=1 Tax=Undibacterium sp. Tian12W TaxID=3413054 RepID=UPI003BEFC0DB
MTINAFDSISQVEATLWEAADQLRANSNLTATEYSMPVLGVIFLRHATNRYRSALDAIQADQAAGKMPNRPLTKADFIKRRALQLPVSAHYDTLLSLPSGGSLGTSLVAAMNAIEADFPPLQGSLPKEYDRFDNKLLENLLRCFDSETLRNATGDVFGRIYEYFLMKFAMQGAQDNGEFFTPPSLVQTLVNVIEPDHGVVADLACGSGGMFVQSSHFIEHEGFETMKRVTFYGQEKTPATIRLAKMNLAVHGLEGDIQEANTFYDDPHRLQDGRPLWGNVDFMMANPPFNVDKVDAETIKTDRRLPFGLPGINKDKHVSNGNYLWISYFHSYLSPKGRAGFVMSSQASSAGHGEKEVRRKLVETGDVDVMIAIRSNFFYTRTVPCELWHFDRAKPDERKEYVLMLDARNVYRKVTRKIFDFSPEQQANLAAIVWLYRGQQSRFLGLIQNYCVNLRNEAVAVAPALTAFETCLTDCHTHLSSFIDGVKQIEAQPQDGFDTARLSLIEAQLEWTNAATSYAIDRSAFVTGLATFCSQYNESPKTNKAQHAARLVFAPLADAGRGLNKQIDLLYKQAALTAQLAQVLTQGEATYEQADKLFERRELNKLIKLLEQVRKQAVEQIKHGSYFQRQITWLQERFPNAEMCDVLGLCRVVHHSEIEAADWSLTPGRFVGVAPAEVDEDFDFEQSLRDIHLELADLNREAAELAAQIQINFEELGV